MYGVFFCHLITLVYRHVCRIEHHRMPRQDGQIVIAADFTADGVYAVKRFKSDPTYWCFLSENSDDDPIRLPKDEMPDYPILGTFVGRVVNDLRG